MTIKYCINMSMEHMATGDFRSAYLTNEDYEDIDDKEIVLFNSKEEAEAEISKRVEKDKDAWFNKNGLELQYTVEEIDTEEL